MVLWPEIQEIVAEPLNGSTTKNASGRDCGGGGHRAGTRGVGVGDDCCSDAGDGWEVGICEKRTGYLCGETHGYEGLPVRGLARRPTGGSIVRHRHGHGYQG